MAETGIIKKAVYSHSEACEYLGGISVWTLRRRARQLRLKVVKLGARRVGWKKETLDQIIERGEKAIR